MRNYGARLRVVKLTAPFAAWCPIGPCLVARDQIRNPQNLRIETKVNGVTKQLSNTSEMILSVVSANFPLPAQMPPSY